MLTTFSSYQLIARDMQRSLARTAAEPITARETKYYLENIGKVSSVDEFMRDSRLYNYAMKAFGLDDMAHAKAYIRKVLVEGVADKGSFANRLVDSRFRDFARVFDFEGLGKEATKSKAAQQGTVDRYMRQSLEESAGQDDEGVRLALYFERKAASIKTPYDILADRALLKVVQTALGIPPEMSAGKIERQAALIAKKLDIASLHEPKGVERFLKRFTSLWDLGQGAPSPTAMLFGGASQSMGYDVLVSLQRIRLGG